MSGTSILMQAFGALPLITGWSRSPRRARDAASELERVKQAEQAAIRRIRLAAQDLRTIGLNLQGIADHLASPSPEVPRDLAVVAAAIFDIADDLHEFTMQAGPAHVLNEEPLKLHLPKDFQLAQTAPRLIAFQLVPVEPGVKSPGTGN